MPMATLTKEFKSLALQKIEFGKQKKNLRIFPTIGHEYVFTDKSKIVKSKSPLQVQGCRLVP